MDTCLLAISEGKPGFEPPRCTKKTPCTSVDSDNTPYEKIGNNEPVSLADEIPFEIPDTWEWVRLGSISTYADTKQKVNAQQADPMIWGLDLEDIEKGGKLLVRKTVGDRKAVGDKTVFARGDILYSKLRPYLLKILIAPDEGICTPEIVPFHLYGDILPEYIVCFLKSPYVDAVINSVTYGVKMPRVGTDTMVNLLVPIPPVAEQIRILEKIREVEPCVDSYALAYQQSELLNNTFSDALKKSILQQAVQGKLVPQDPSDESATILLERIRKEKEQLIKTGKLKRDKHESVIFRRDNSHYEKLDGSERCIDDEIPFDIPDSWSWQRLPSIAYSISAGGDKPAVFSKEKTTDCLIPVYSNGEKNNGLFGYTNEPRIIEKSITISGRGTIGFSCVRTEPYVPIVRLISVIPSSDMDLYYLQYVFTSLFEEGVGTSIQQLTVPMLITKLIPIPPIAEQKRIVQKVQELFSKLTML